MPSPKKKRKAGQDIYSVNFADYLPGALKHDTKMRAIAAAVTKEALTVSREIENVLIYSRIDELPEALIDILAYDMHVDWYDYSFPLEVKRDILKGSVNVHKKMGTKYAVEKALGALYPQSEVEEWFQYEGQPHHFHIICDVTENRVTASFQEIINAVMMYKRLSSHLDEVVYQASVGIRVETHTDFFLYKNLATGSLLAGTYPQRIRRGVQAGNVIVVGTDVAGFIFLPTQVGIYPYRNIMFRHTGTQIDAETASRAYRYRNISVGQINAGEEPQRSHRGAETGARIETQAEADGFPFFMQATGTKPERNVVMNNFEAGIAAEEATEGFLYTVKAAGTVPERNTREGTGSGGIESTVKAEIFKHTNKPCGSRRKL